MFVDTNANKLVRKISTFINGLMSLANNDTVKFCLAIRGIAVRIRQRGDFSVNSIREPSG